MAKAASKTIGVILDWLVFGDNPLYYQTTILEGVDCFCRDRDYNMSAFTVGRFDSPYLRETKNNFLCNLVTAKHIDGVIIYPSIGFFSGQPKLESLVHSLSPVPAVVLGNRFEGVTSVIIDNYRYMKEIISHLIVIHKLNRIAFIKGSVGNHDAEIRFNAYRDTLSENGIAYDERLVVQGSFVVRSGLDAANHLMDNGVSFDAIAAANDQMAIGAIRALEARGVYGFPVTGFDNNDGAKNRGLTTVDQLLYEEGYTCAHLVAEMIEGRKVDPVCIVPCKFIQRSSCGCPPESVAVINKDEEFNPNYIEDSFSHDIRQINKNIEDPVQKSAFLSIINELEQTIAEEGAPAKIVLVWEKFLKLCQREKISSGKQLSLFSSLRRKIISMSKNNRDVNSATSGITGMGIMTGLYSENFSNQYDTHTDTLTQSLDNLGEDLFDTLDLKRQMELLFSRMPQFGIESCLVARYLDFDNPLDRAQALLAYTPDGRLDNGDVFSTKELYPAGFIDSLKKKRYSIIVQPFSSGDKVIGYMAATIDVLKDKNLLMLRSRINTALKESLYIDVLEKRINERKDELVDINSRLTKSLDNNRLLMRELEHRVKNNLSVVASLLNLEALSSEQEEVKKVLTEARTRIESMAAIYERLYLRPETDNRIDIGPYIRDLVKSLLQTYSLGKNSVNLIFTLEECSIDIRKGISLGLLVNELLSNALKYAWKEGESGNLKIALRHEEGRLILEVSDDGVGLPDAVIEGKSKSLGLVLVRAFAAELGAELKFSNESGSKISVSFTC